MKLICTKESKLQLLRVIKIGYTETASIKLNKLVIVFVRDNRRRTELN